MGLTVPGSSSCCYTFIEIKLLKLTPTSSHLGCSQTALKPKRRAAGQTKQIISQENKETKRAKMCFYQ